MDAQDRIAELLGIIAAKDAEIAQQRARIAELEEKLSELVGKLSQNSRNSNKPPSSDPFGGKHRRKKKSGRKRGGQPGHKGHSRELLPESEVSHIENCYPKECENCWQPLSEKPDPHATRHQVTEISKVLPNTTEYRCHEVLCRCGYKTRGKLPAEVPSSPFGPHLEAVIGLLSGVYHLSRRKTVGLLRDLLGVRLSLGAVSAVEARVSEAVQAAVNEAWKQVDRAKVKHTDGTGWLQAGVALAVWTLSTAMVTVFKIVVDNSRNTLLPLFGKLSGILVSDRAATLSFWAMERRQICWAHLLRKFVAFSERDGPVGVLGRKLLDYTGLLFEYWHSYKDGRMSREMFAAWMRPVREGFEAALEQAVSEGLPGAAGSCKNVLAHRLALFTFVDQAGVEPTNNHAERELRAFVLWRKRSFGSQSERGNLYAERLMTVAHTARKQKRDVLGFLSASCEAQHKGMPAPSLFESPSLRAAA